MNAPSLNPPAWVEGPLAQKYPFTIKPDNRLTVENIFAIHRDNYEGTEFDLDKGLAAGRFGVPTVLKGQAENMADKEGSLTAVEGGGFERPLGIYRTVYTCVNQSATGCLMPLCKLTCFGPDRPASAVS